ncbi:MAG: folylpolyglutamate synthase/dihydrofolate synthase family protein [Thermoproteota archaeon]|jgi:folylpolyglutamate synthase/dihydrofolate synthase
MRKFESYEEFLYWLYNLRRFGMTYGVENVKVLLKEFDNPQEKIKSVLITGSGGKGSTVEIVSKILEESGYKTGKFIKPHLNRFTERIIINSNEIRKEEVVELANEIIKKLERIKSRMEYYPTFFEITYVLSLLYFLKEKVDICVYEVGIGGRYDATNTLDPLVSALTAVYLEHTKILGNTLKEIAWNKVGIARKNRYFVSAKLPDEAMNVVFEECQNLNCKLYIVSESNSSVHFKKIVSNLNNNIFDYYGIKRKLEEIYLSLLGEHQISNASISICLCELLENYNFNVNDSAIRKALSKVKWPGRLEIIVKEGIKFILDCAKDPTAIKILCDFLKKNLKSKPLTIVGISSDKDYKSMIKSLVEFTDSFVFTKHNVMGRAISPEILEETAKNLSEKITATKTNSVEEAVKYAIESSKRDDYILVTGSVFTVGEARRYILNEEYDSLFASDPLP